MNQHGTAIGGKIDVLGRLCGLEGQLQVGLTIVSPAQVAEYRYIEAWFLRSSYQTEATETSHAMRTKDRSLSEGSSEALPVYSFQQPLYSYRRIPASRTAMPQKVFGVWLGNRDVFVPGRASTRLQTRDSSWLPKQP